MAINVLPNPFIDFLGAHLVEWETDYCSWKLEVTSQHTNTQGSLHGGVIATLLDVACGYAGFCPDNGRLEHRAATLSLSIQYLAKAHSGTLLARGHRIGGGHRIFFAEAQLLSGDQLIATASGSFRRHKITEEDVRIPVSR